MMAEATIMKGLYAKMDIILTTMDERKEKIMMAMDQREES